MEDTSKADGIATEEGWHTTSDGHKLYTKKWLTPEAPKAILVFIHGFSDHCNAYGILFPRFAARGIEVHSFDQRGWGRSVHKASEKGLTGPTSQVLDDITSFIKPLLPPKPDVPLFVMGHSMGGAEVLTYMAQGPESVKKYVRGWLLESPFVAFNPASKPSPIVVVLGRLAGKLFPHMQMVQKLDPALLCRDVQVQKDFVADKLCHDTGTLEGLAAMLDRAAGLDGGHIKIPKDAGEDGTTRVWLSHGTKDGVCDFHGSERLYKRWDYIMDKELVELDGWLHKLHAEPSPDKEEYAKRAADWILNRAGSLDSLKSRGY
ncbi:hypothetical protein, variant [Verruconis gallopava]|uniref:Serine aminopeptidase S33 domain-containing protein n=1 Tax=Verruconis gallopava TaxID=253628 RepID=A0A0D1YPN8_9PEZI|nr:hypothetical protein, variant [Verruconis gallopava]KIW02582.1 hypothetical protein, variant [Verruconis gallopava]